jgi:protein-disulfide isomerase
MSKREELRKRRQAQTRQRQLLVVGAVAVVAVLVAAWLILPTLQPVGEIVTVAAKEYPLAEGSALGPADAPALVEVFSDFQCPNCRQFAQSVETRLIDTYGPTGQVRIDYKHYIVIDGNVGGSESRQAAEASECAAQQNQFWPYHDILFANWRGEGVGSFTNQRLVAMAETIGLDMEAFNTCFNSNATSGIVSADQADGTVRGVNGTPTVFINGAAVPQQANTIFSFEYFQQRLDPLIQ